MCNHINTESPCNSRGVFNRVHVTVKRVLAWILNYFRFSGRHPSHKMRQHCTHVVSYPLITFNTSTFRVLFHYVKLCRPTDVALTLRDIGKSEYLGEILLSATLWPRTQEDKDQVSYISVTSHWSVQSDGSAKHAYAVCDTLRSNTRWGLLFSTNSNVGQTKIPQLFMCWPSPPVITSQVETKYSVATLGIQILIGTMHCNL